MNLSNWFCYAANGKKFVNRCCSLLPGGQKFCKKLKKGRKKYLLVEELCSEFVLIEKISFPNPLKNTNDFEELFA